EEHPGPLESPGWLFSFHRTATTLEWLKDIGKRILIGGITCESRNVARRRSLFCNRCGHRNRDRRTYERRSGIGSPLEENGHRQEVPIRRRGGGRREQGRQDGHHCRRCLVRSAGLEDA